ncbi:UDP-glycosyltransferase UGT5-like isoform X1 [Anastrepha ludens]|uniref:UDP-glycosyltransferase UGT5-like isoform X1 n=1 Tax=Anastrepha ludens TaxID=28586 RepID=UPI0023B137A9|nr:UDP-glycosyltransferase UGT5-like isoform X1 [Anastrepha ludens]
MYAVAFGYESDSVFTSSVIMILRGTSFITVAFFFVFLLGGFVSLPSLVHSARILGFFPSPSPSHLRIHCAIADALNKAGHNVTVLSSTKNPYKWAKYEYIQLDLPLFPKDFLRRLVKKEQSLIARYPHFIKEVTNLANQSFSNPNLKHFLATHGAGSFDLIVLGYFMNDFHLGLSAHFEAPIVISFMVQPIFAVHNLVKNPIEAAYVPTLFSECKQPLDFWERVQNFVVSIFETYFITLKVERESQKFYDYNFPPDRYPPLDEVRKNVSLVFVNHHFSQGPIRPNVPNLIEIGGIQIKEKPDPLPADIGKVLDEAKEGVIYFSLGTNIQSTHLTEEKAKIMFNVISKLPYKVLWKWGDSDRPGQSNNIIYKDWLPQDDILAHPNIKLFITHGGMGSVVEAQYHGVPMVGIPLFGDQPSNMANVERSGYGLSVDYITLSEESLNKAIQEVLHNPKYTKTVRDFSRLYRDRPMSPRETVVYWVEYVLRHNGAKHMQSPAVHMNRWQLMSLDVIGFLLAIVGCVVAVFVKICMLLCCRRKTKTAKVTKVKVKKAKKNE